MAGVRTGKAVKHISLVQRIEILGRDLHGTIESIWCDRPVDLAPPDRVVDAWRVFEQLVVRASSGAGTGQADQRAFA